MKKLLILIIVILIVVLGYKIVAKPSNNKNNVIERTEILSLIDKPISYENINIKADTTLSNIHTGEMIGEDSQEWKFKDNIGIKLLYGNVKMIWYVDYAKNTSIQFYTNDKTRVVANTDLAKEHPQNEYIKRIKDFDYSYKFITKENYKNIDCIVFELSKEDHIEKFWLNSNTGIIQKIEFYTKANQPKKWIKYQNIEYTTTFDMLTDEDMKMPNLSEYTLTDVYGKPI